MSATNAFETDLLELIFNGTTITNIADNTASSPATNLYVSLHTSDPGEGGDQSSNETSYGSYARVAVARTSGGWTVSSNSVTNVGEIAFPQCDGGSSTITHFGIGLASSSTGTLLIKGELASPLNVSNGVAPRFAASNLTINID